MIEPFKEVELAGGSARKVQMRWGNEERPLYACLRALKPGVAVKWSDRFAPLEATAVEWAFASALESALGVQVDGRSQVLRAFHCEVQNLIAGFQYLYRFFFVLRDLVRTEQCLYFRELSLNLMETLTGGRVLPQFLRIGGVEKDLTVGEVRKTREALDVIRSEMEAAFGNVGADGLVAQGLSDVMILGASLIENIGLGGAVAAASGRLVDLRWSGQSVYTAAASAQRERARLSSLKVKGDALSRMTMSIERVRFSMTLAFELLDALKHLPATALPAHRTDLSRIEWNDLPARQQFRAVVESYLGPIEAIVSQDGVLFRTNSTRMKSSIESMLVGVHREDLEVAYASLGFDQAQGDLA